MNITFHVVEGARPGQVTLATPVVVGRGRETKLTLPLPLISREHCEVFEHQQSAWIRDLGSTNGTLVQGQRIAAPTPVDNGQTISVGSVTLRLEFTVQQDGASTPTADLQASLEPIDSMPQTVDYGNSPQGQAAPNPGFAVGDPMAAVPNPQPTQPEEKPQLPPPGAIPMAMPLDTNTSPPAETPPPEPRPSDDDDLNDFLGGLK